MCGIYGALRLDGGSVDPAILERMDPWVAHRGPDGRGAWSRGPVTLGHRLLAIVAPPEEGRQPMATGHHTAITYNGELYGYEDGRRDLAARGERFETRTDTEVMLRTVERDGIGAMDRFDGLWAFALWQDDTKTLHLARDRFGIKPLFYASDGDHFLFASTPQAIGAALRGGFALDQEAVGLALAAGPVFEAGDRTLYQGLHRLPPGHRLELTVGKQPRLVRWWRTVDRIGAELAVSPAEQILLVRERLEHACRRRVPARVPAAVSVSGGLDSGALAVLFNHLARVDGGLKTTAEFTAVSATFTGSEKDETEYARAIHAALDFGSRELAIDVDRPGEIVDSSLRAGWDLRPMHAVQWDYYRHLRAAGYKVSIDGHGADELFAGYVHHFPAAATPDTLDGLRDGYARALGIEGWRRLETYGIAIPQALRDPTADPPEALGPSARDIVPWIAEDLAQMGDAPPLARTLYADLHATSLPAMLNGYDEMSMAHGMEIWVPYLDWDLVLLALSLPADRKIWKGFTKAHLRAAVQDLLPKTIVNRRLKLGFGGPKASMLSGPLRSRMTAAFTEAAKAGRPWCPPGIVDGLEGSTPDRLVRLWPLFQATQLQAAVIDPVAASRGR